MTKNNIIKLIIFILVGLAIVLGGYLFFKKVIKGWTVERTLAIIKPDAVKAKNSGKIIDRIEQEGFNILGMKKIQLTKIQAENFYAVHKGKPFYNELVEFMISGPVVVMVLEKQDAIKAWRDLMGDTDATKAAANTLRRLFGTSKGENATHGSDAPETAATEIKFFFPELK